MTRGILLLAAAAVGLLVTPSAHSSPGGVYTIGTDTRYTCHHNYVTNNTVGLMRIAVLLGAADIRACQALCDSTRGCVAFSFQRRVQENGTVTTGCALYSRRDVGTMPISDAGRFDWGAVCYREFQPPPDYLRPDPRGRQALDVNPHTTIDGLRQDQLRPGLPGPSLPNKP